MTAKKKAPHKGVPTSGARLAKWLANPGLRSRLPSSVLTPAQRAERTLNSPVLPGSTLTNRQLNQGADAAAAQQYGSAITSGQQGLQASQQFATDIASWYDQYQKSLQDNAAKIQAANQGTNAAMQSLLGANSKVGAANQATTANALQGVGAQVDPSIAAKAGQATNVSNTLAGSYGAQLAAQGNSAYGEALNRSGNVAPLLKIQAGKEAQGNIEKARQTLQDYINQSNAAKTSYKQKELDNQQVLSLNTTKATDTATSRAASLKSSNHKWASTVNKYGVTNGAWADYGKTSAGKAKRQAAIDAYNTVTHPPKTPKAPKAGSNGFASLTQERTTVQHIKGAQTAVSTLMAKPGASLSEIRLLLQAGKFDGVKYSHDEITAAFDLYQNNNQLTPAGVAALRHLKIHVNGNFKIAKPKATTPAAINPATLHL